MIRIGDKQAIQLMISASETEESFLFLRDCFMRDYYLIEKELSKEISKRIPSIIFIGDSNSNSKFITSLIPKLDLDPKPVEVGNDICN